MKLASYSYNGREAFGLVVGRGIVDLHRLYSGRYGNLREFLSSPEFPRAASFAAAPPDMTIDEVEFLPIVADPDKIFGVGANYLDEAGEPPAGSAPALFIRYPYTQVGHGVPLRKPALSDAYDYEGELAVIIGRDGRDIPP